MSQGVRTAVDRCPIAVISGHLAQLGSLHSQEARNVSLGNQLENHVNYGNRSYRGDRTYEEQEDFDYEGPNDENAESPSPIRVLALAVSDLKCK